MVKVILLSGSPRGKSNTVDVLKVCAEAIEAEGVENQTSKELLGESSSLI